MRASLYRLFGLLSLIALLALSNVRTAPAHDFPMKRAFDHVCHIDAYSAESQRLVAREPAPTPQLICPLTTSTVALAQAYQSLLTGVSQSSTYLAEGTRRLQSLWSHWQAAVAPPINSISVAQPDPGIPPAPKTKAQSIVPPILHAKKLFVEDYAPYDLCIRDWRFGSFQDADRSPTQPPRQMVAESAAAVALGNFLCKVDHWQCLATDFCSPSGGLERWTESLTGRLVGVQADCNATSISLWPQDADIPNRLPIHTAPQFVVYETPEGDHVLLTVEQARSWQFSSHTAKDGTADQNNFETLPGRKHVMTQVSRQLHSAGNALLQLADYFDRLADSKLAGKLDGELR